MGPLGCIGKGVDFQDGRESSCSWQAALHDIADFVVSGRWAKS